MSAAKTQPIVPLYREGIRFWDELVAECRREVESFNRAAAIQGTAAPDLIRFQNGMAIRLEKAGLPSTQVEVRLAFESWGPVLRGCISGEQISGRRFLTKEVEIPIGSDLDGSVVAIFDEGRSFTPSDLTRYFLQSFRRCYPDLLLRY